MSGQGEEEKLLQDASTLLMFAKVAAKHLEVQQLFGNLFNSDTSHQTYSREPSQEANKLPESSPKLEREKSGSIVLSESIKQDQNEAPPARVNRLNDRRDILNRDDDDPQTSFNKRPSFLNESLGANSEHELRSKSEGLSEPENVATKIGGINVHSVERNSSNAMIAAAALAAAADNPLPLKRYSEAMELEQKSRNLSPSTLPIIQAPVPTSIRPNPQIQLMQSPKEQESSSTSAPSHEPNHDNGGDRAEENEIDYIKNNNESNTAESASVVNDGAVISARRDDLGEKEEKSYPGESFKDKTSIRESVQDTVQESTQAKELTMQPLNTISSEDGQDVMPIVTQPIDQQSVKLELEGTIIDKAPLSSYQVAPDAGLIGCICEIEEDDGFTVQCDVCFRWQHCVCMGFFTNEEVPEDEYKCHSCDPHNFQGMSKETAQFETHKRLQEQKLANERKINKRKQSGQKEKVDKRRKRLSHDEQPPLTSQESSSRGKSDITDDSNPAELSIVPPVTLPDPENELLEDGVTAESYQSLYYTLKKIRYSGKREETYCRDVLKTLPSVSFDSQAKFSKLILPALELISPDKGPKSSNGTKLQVRPYSEIKLKLAGLGKFGLFVESENGIQEGQEFQIPTGTSILEYLGEVVKFEDYKDDPVNQYELWATTKPQVVKVSNVDLVIDARFCGNEARFARKACPSASNCLVEAVQVGPNSLGFILKTSKPITLTADKPSEELRLEWSWAPDHPILEIYRDENSKIERFNPEDKSFLISSINNILQFVECGCSSSDQQGKCGLYKVKKFTAYLMRSTKKASSISNINLMKSKEELVPLRKLHDYVSLQQRILNRDDNLANNLHQDQEPFKPTSTEINSDKPVKPKELFLYPYKRTLFTMNSDMIGKHSPKTSSEPRFIPVPVIPDQQKQIQKEINLKLNLTREKELETTTALAAEPTSATEKNSIASPKGVEDTQAAPVAPSMKKKLSFADYKKKMK